MSVKLYKPGFEHAKELVRKDKVVLDNRDAWSEHQLTAQQDSSTSFATGRAAWAIK